MNTPSTPSAASRPEGIENPWLRAFLAEPWDTIVLAQILIRRAGEGFELRHIDDRLVENLKPIRLTDVRKIASYNAAGGFRPLKSAPNLQPGWQLRANTPHELETALNHFYPNALADRFAGGPITDYRPFTARQTGMYRITTFLSDSDAARVITQTCNPNSCLKQRLWTVAEFPTDSPYLKSLIPCLEPCAILLENARKEVRAMQEAEKGGSS